MESLYPDLVKLLIEKYLDVTDSLKLFDIFENFASHKNTYNNILSDSIKGWNYCIENDKLDACKFIYQRTGNNIDITVGLQQSCQYGHLNIAQWLINISNKISYHINIHDYSEYVFRKSCEYGHLDVAQWLVTLSNKTSLPINIHVYDEYAFRWSCKCGHLNVAQWLIQYSNEINSPINIHADYERAFMWSCDYDHLDAAQWLIQYSNKINSPININVLTEYSKKLII